MARMIVRACSEHVEQRALSGALMCGDQSLEVQDNLWHSDIELFPHVRIASAQGGGNRSVRHRAASLPGGSARALFTTRTCFMYAALPKLRSSLSRESGLGQKRKCRRFRVTSAFPPIATELRTSRDVSKVLDGDGFREALNPSYDLLLTFLR